MTLQSLGQESAGVAGRKILQPPERPVSELAVEAGCLEAERVKPDPLDASATRFCFSGLHELRPKSLSAILVRYPEQIDVQPAKKYLASQPSNDPPPFAKRNR